MPDKLTQLKQMTVVVADTGDIDAIRRFTPEDATTNPSLLLKAAALPAYADLVKATVAAHGSADLSACVDSLAVEIGSEIAAIVPGRVSTEVDARLSFNSDSMIKKAEQLIDLYAKQGIGKERILIKIASTWEGIKAAEQLEKRGINCNLTLLFGFCQAQACADAGVTLISPFVGRILDWHKARGLEPASADDDPGVQSVGRIYQYYKQHGYDTVVMGASFRNTGEIEALAGCDRLTISPALLQELADDDGELPRRLAPDMATESIARQTLNEADFRYHLNDDAMATEKLAEGIRNFAADQEKLEQLLAGYR